LPGGGTGTPRGADRARRSAVPVPDVGGRRGQRRAGPDVDGSRLGTTARADDRLMANRAVVVGASSGLGRCIGVGLAKRGSSVALLARREERLAHAVAEAGDNAVAIACDGPDEASV